MITFGFNLLRLQQTCMNYLHTFEILYEAIKFHLVGTMNVNTKSMSSIQQMSAPKWWTSQPAGIAVPIEPHF